MTYFTMDGTFNDEPAGAVYRGPKELAKAIEIYGTALQTGDWKERHYFGPYKHTLTLTGEMEKRLDMEREPGVCKPYRKLFGRS